MSVAFLLLAMSAGGQELKVFPVTIEIETQSDWTTVTIEGLSISKYEVVEGARAPDLRVSAGGSTVSIGKRQYDTTRVVVDVEGYIAFAGDAVEVVVDKGDLEYTTVRVYTVVEGARKLVWNFTNSGVVPGSGGVNTRRARLPVSALAGAELRVRVREPAVPKMVLAFYYPWYGNPQGVSGRWYHWDMVSYREIGTATDYPLLGPYDSWDPRVVRSHIRMAKAAGIDGFVSSWWGPGTFEDEAFARMLDVAAEEGFKLTIYYESVRELTADQISAELAYVLKRYSGHPAFLRFEGRPVIFVYAVGAYQRSPSFWRGVIERAENSSGVKAVWIADTFDTAYLSVFDGLHTYNPIWISDHLSTYLREARLVKSYVGVPSGGEVVRKLWVATVNPGYDDRKIRKPGTYVPREGGAYYRRTWEAALASEPDAVLICTWSEWHEGTEVEPSREYGFAYLDLTREYAARYKAWQPPPARAPQIGLNLSASDNLVTIEVVNRGDEPAVITQLLVTNASLGVAVEPEGFRAYRLQVNSTTSAAFLPFIGPGERVSIRAVATGSPVRVLAQSWSATGQRATAEAAVEAKPAQQRQPKVTGSGGGAPAWQWPLAAAAAAGVLLLRRRRRGPHS